MKKSLTQIMFTNTVKEQITTQRILTSAVNAVKVTDTNNEL